MRRSLDLQRRLEKVLAHIEKNLERPLDLRVLADLVHLSPFHFHRLFGSWKGESVASYVRRRRLELAALKLRATRATVLDVALCVGFSTPETFSRAFGRHFGKAPAAWRNDSKKRHADRAEAAHHGDVVVTTGAPKLNVDVLALQPVNVAYMWHIGAYGPGVGRFWTEVFDPWRRKNQLLENTAYGISLDDPRITPPDHCITHACVEVDESFVGHGLVHTKRLPGGLYAVARFSGTSGQIGAAWESLLGEWLPSSSYLRDGRPQFERFLHGILDSGSGVLEAELCVPVVPRRD